MTRTALVALCVAACSKSDRDVKPSPEVRPAASDPDASSCALAIVVDPVRVSIGTPAGACYAARVAGKPDVAWVEAELRALRSAFASCSVRALVVAETGPYQELITIMDIAIKTGFVDTDVGDTSDLRFAVTGASDAHCKLPPPPREKAAARAVEQRAPALPLTPEQADRLVEGIPLPPPSTKSDLQHAPVIVVTQTQISFQGTLVASVDAVARDPQALKALADVLHAHDNRSRHELAAGSLSPELVQACEDAQLGIRPRSGRICPLGLAILQADEATDMRVINSVLHTAKAAGFDNILFAVKGI